MPTPLFFPPTHAAQVSGGTYRAYMQALGGWFVVAFFLLLSIFAQVRCVHVGSRVGVGVGV
jgi:hypothetical protein